MFGGWYVLVVVMSYVRGVGCTKLYNTIYLRVGLVLDVGLPPADSMLPVNSATRALILATRDSIAVSVSISFSQNEPSKLTLFSTCLSIVSIRLLTVASSALLLTLTLSCPLSSVLSNLCPSVLSW